MKLIDKSYIEQNKVEIISALQNGSIFIYPTDTIYGLGCNAEIDEAVSQVREIKMRDDRPISILAPSKEWIEANCAVDLKVVDEYLPGPYTLIVKRRTDAVSREINPNDDTLGVRIPKHWFSDIVAAAGVPFVTTSVNISGEKHMENLEEVPQEILDQVDYVVYEGEKRGVSSQKVNLL